MDKDNIYGITVLHPAPRYGRRDALETKAESPPPIVFE
jgi:hypothetical protein